MLGLYVGKIFQYISCSYLSYKGNGLNYADGNFNTSHVLIYRMAFKRIGGGLVNFNTSHVLIYRSAAGNL